MSRKEKLVAYVLKLSDEDVYDLIIDVISEVDVATGDFRSRVIRGLEKDENAMSENANVGDIARYLKDTLSRYDLEGLKALL